MRSTIACSIVLWASVAYAEGPFKSLSFEEARKAAKEQDKIVLIDFYTTWCAPCKLLDKTTWKDEKVCKWLEEKTIALKIDAEKERALAGRFNVQGYPTILLLKPDGKEIDRLVGYRAAAEFLEEAEAALSGKDSVVRAKEKLNAAGRNDPMQRMQYARVLEQKGKYKEALKEYLWCFDHGLEHGPGFTGVRLSFLLGDIHRLGSSYPPAIEALEKRRDQAEAILLGKVSGKARKARKAGRDARFTAAMEVRALNRELEENERTLRIYEKAIAAGEQDALLLNVLMEEILGDLIEAKRYGDIVAGLPDPLGAVDREIDGYERIKAFHQSREKEGIPDPSERLKEKALREGGQYYEALVGSKKLVLAKKVAKRLLRFEGGGATYAMLIEHAVRAGGRAEALRLVKEARTNLDGDDLEEAEEAAKNIPPEEL